MKKALVSLILGIMSLAAYGQQIELTENGFVDVVDKTKNYIVIEVPNTPKETLYKTVKRYINSVYNNPKYVTTEIDNEQIVIDAIDNEEMKVIFRLNGTNLWYFNYKYDIQFKDNKVKFTPYFKCLSNNSDIQEINLIGSSFLGTTTGIFNSKGKILKDKAKLNIENSVNNYILQLKTELLNLNKKQDKNW